ncbi:tripartite tricarboxylate transporter TctB family protein [Agrobacterium sp. SOY23]|uniref:tripartite tricarboxylate transporter TctB family protein n=1 Tax=Agrobacterium sp. SOY23 TaxID=3014555 RepID=UPI001B127119|nr:tripartite tricarboxylate transporter TctB family protein [Agrobacterium sp. SOY23]MBO9655552.1 tripartite tricarboxylate transporter TctB family protein [Agrobacterium tumefaciens]MCZ4429137.1 tripartite tricarboxylate transporter TctB family protein [Agrobacterium sp. SOY23]
MKSFIVDPAEAICGAIFIGLGAFFALQSYGLEIGTAFRMGPGYFPLVLAVILVLLGGVIFLRSTRVQGEAVGAIAWRGIFFILPAPIFFGLTVRGLGFVPALFFSALIAAFASHRMNPFMAVILSAAITVFSVAVFNYGLGLPFQRFGPWLKF